MEHQRSKRDRILFWMICLMALVIPFVRCALADSAYGIPKATAIQLFALAIGMIFVVQIVTSGAVSVRKNKGYVFMGLFLFINAISLIGAENKHEAFFTLKSLCSFILAALIIAEVLRARRDIKTFLYVIILAGAGSALYDFVIHGGIDFSVTRESHKALLGHYNFAGEYVMIPFILSLGMLFGARSRFRFMVLLAAACATGIFVFLTQQRGAWLGCMGGAGFVFLCYGAAGYSRFSRFKRTLLIGIPLAILIAGSVMIFLARDGSAYRDKFPPAVGNITSRFLSIFDPENYARKTRLLVWKDTVRIIKDAPLLGHGIGNFKIQHMKYRSSSERAFTGQGIKYVKAHNEYLNIASESGMLGLALFIACAAYFLSCLYGMRKNSISAARDPTIVAIAGTFVGCFIQGMFGYNLVTVPSGAMTFWMLGGVSLALSRAENKENEKIFIKEIKAFKKGTGILRGAALVALFVIFAYFIYDIPKRLISSVFIRAGMINYRSGNLKKSEAALKKAEEWYFADEQIGFFLGRIYQRRGEEARADKNKKLAVIEFDKAIEHYKKALRLYPYYEIIINNLGATYTLNGQPEKAYEIYKKAMKLNPLHAGTRMNLALYYYKKGRIAESKNELDVIDEVDKEFFDQNPQFIKYRNRIEELYEQMVNSKR